jgi:hypothetical protein
MTGPLEVEDVAGVPEESAVSIMSRLVFNWDGTISKDQLAGVPQELIDRITSPEFVAQARESIRRARGIHKTGRRESRRPAVRFHSNGEGLNRKQRRRMGLHRMPVDSLPVTQG